MNRRRSFPLLLALLAGCSGVQVVAAPRVAGPTGEQLDPDSTWYLNSDVWGFTLLSRAPLVSGDVARPGKLAWFTNTTTLEGAVRMLEDAAAALGADELHDVRSDITSDHALLIFWLPEARASALATRSPAIKALAPLEERLAPPAR